MVRPVANLVTSEKGNGMLLLLLLLFLPAPAAHNLAPTEARCFLLPIFIVLLLAARIAVSQVISHVGWCCGRARRQADLTARRGSSAPRLPVSLARIVHVCHTHTRAYTHKRTHMRAHTYIHTQTTTHGRHTHTHTPTHTHTYTHARAYARRHTRSHASCCMYIYM